MPASIAYYGRRQRRPVLCGGTPALTARRHDVADRIGIGTRLVFSGPCDLSAWEIPAERRSDDADEPPRGIGIGGGGAARAVNGIRRGVQHARARGSDLRWPTWS